MTPKTFSWLVGTAGGAAALVWTVIQMWPTLGWTTPNQHDTDMMVTQNAIIEKLDELERQQQRRHAEWKCDEYDEELLALLERQETDDSVELRRDIEKIRDKMRELECSEFDDFG